MAVRLGAARLAAIRSGIGLQYVLKEARVFDVLERLCPVLLSADVAAVADAACKGGTAINKAHLGGLQRFSEDVDLDIFFREGMSRDEKVRFIRESIMPSLSGPYEVRGEHRRKNVIHFACGFDNEAGARDSVFVEFSLAEIPLSHRATRGARSTLLPLAVDRIPTYTIHRLLADKAMALYRRDDGKDVYDMHRGLRIAGGFGDAARILGRALDMEGIGRAEFRDAVMGKLADGEAISGMHGSTNPYVPKSLRTDWAEAAAEIAGRISPFL